MNAMSTMLKTIPATVSPDGTVVLSEAIELDGPVAAVVTLAFETEGGDEDEPALLSEAALEDWNRKEEDEAWSYLLSVA